MPKCGVCGWLFSERTMFKHADTICGNEEIKAPIHQPEIDDLIRAEEETSGRDIHVPYM